MFVADFLDSGRFPDFYTRRFFVLVYFFNTFSSFDVVR